MPSQVLGILTLCMQESPTGQLFQYVRASVDVKAKKDILHLSVRRRSGGRRGAFFAVLALAQCHQHRQSILEK